MTQTIPKLLTKKNIPDSFLIGKGTLTVLECKNEQFYKAVEESFRGHIFHSVKDGRYFIRVPKAVLKQLKEYIED